MLRVDPTNVVIIDEESAMPQEPCDWGDEVQTEEVRVIARIKPVYGIVITQDCDTRDKYISFCLIDGFSKIVKDNINQKDPDKWWGQSYPGRARVQPKWFYLPVDTQLGFQQKMAASFQDVFQVRREFLQKHIAQLRMGRLNDIAYEHFRERVAQYFRRYSYNEWYPLTKDEFQHYQQKYPDTEPFDWQE